MNSFRSGYITLVGVPNAGKSSLVNALVKESVSIVTSKPQTTRKRTMGILTEPEKFQMIFVDTPGVIESNDGLNPYLKNELTRALEDVDVIVCAIGPWEFKNKDKPWAIKLGQTLNPAPLYVLTQTDTLKGGPEQLEEVENKFKSYFEKNPPPLLRTSSRTSLGLVVLKKLILERLPEGPQYYDTDIFTPQTMREISAEIIRKHCFEQLHQELPYGLAVLVQGYDEGGQRGSQSNQIIKISADILVSRESHKPMVIGKGAQVLKQIGVRSRFELEKLTGQKIFLKLHVVVKQNWLKDKTYMEELGYGV
jgi:GTP-binding protein Era